MRFCIRVRVQSVGLVIVALAVAALSEARGGIVYDPHHRVIVGAQVTLSCTGVAKQTVATDSRGRFELSLDPSLQDCKLAISHPGFATFEQGLKSDLEVPTISLHIATDKQFVNVTSNADDIREIGQLSIGSASVSDAELRTIANNTEDLLRYAKARAGSDTSEDAIYVNGLPSTALQPANMIIRIDVDTDPFSAEYSDSDKTHINITTKNADRHLRLYLGGGGLGVGGGNPLAAASHAAMHSTNLGLTGGILQLPLTFSLQGNLSSLRNEEPIAAIGSIGQNSVSRLPSAVVGNRNTSGQFNLQCAASGSSQIDLSFADSGASGFNIGVGGLTLPGAGSASLLRTREGRVTFAIADHGYVYRGGLVLDWTSSWLRANSSALGVSVVGAFVDGGAPMTRSQARRTSWFWKNVLQSSAKRHLFSAGFTVTRVELANDDQPNAFGSIQFTSLQNFVAAESGNPTGTWFLIQGNGHVHYAPLEFAPFFQGDLFHSERLLLTGGIRGDYQTKGGMTISPRLSLAARLRGFVFRAGGGQFVHAWPGSVFAHVIEDDGFHLQSFITQNVPLPPAGGPISVSPSLFGNRVVAQLSPNLSLPRDWMFKVSVEHAFGTLTPGLEYTRIDGQHLLGSERTLAPAGWLDLLESNRARRRQQLHARLRLLWKSQDVTAHYEWIWSHDDTSGPFSFPQNQGSLRTEWARSAGVAPRNLTLVDNFKLPWSVSINLMATSRSSTPYNVTTGLDNGNGLYNDRGGRPRNSGNGPRYNSLDFSGYRRIPLPLPGKPEKRLYADLGVRVSNVLGNKNYTSYDSVVDSQLFGKPLGAGPGRALRFWMNLN